MPFSAILTPSPVSPAFPGIQWDPLDKLRLSNAEKSLLRSGEDNPVDYTLSNTDDASMYSRALLKVLAESSGPSGPSAKVSKIKERSLPMDEALQFLYTDPTGVVTHYAISKLYEVISSLRERKSNHSHNSVSMVSTFYTPDGKLSDDWRPLLRILHLGGGGDPFSQRGASLCLAYILMTGCPSQQSSSSEGGSGNGTSNGNGNNGLFHSSTGIDYASVKEPLQALLSWISSQLQSSSGASVSLVTPTLTALVNCSEARYMFASSGGIGYIARHLRMKNGNNNYMSPASASSSSSRRKEAGASVQQLYELGFAIWAMTYECPYSYSVRSAFARDGAVKSLCDLVKSAPREKVVRVALSSLRNLAECTSDGEGADVTPAGKKVIDGAIFLNDMISCGLMKSVDLMKERQWTDIDIVEDIKALNKLLHGSFKEMSRWDIYENEVISGNLEWGILHTEKFFIQNNRQLEGKDGNFNLLKRLILLVSHDDEDVAAVACYDIGEFVRHYPNGRLIAKQLGAKDAMMKLIGHENPDLQRHALQSVSKMLVQNWASMPSN